MTLETAKQERELDNLASYSSLIINSNAIRATTLNNNLKPGPF